MRTLIISSLAFFATAGTAFAAPLDPSQMEMTHGPAVMPAASVSGETHTNTGAPATSNGNGNMNEGVRTNEHMGEPVLMHNSSTTSNTSGSHPPIRNVMAAIIHGVPGTVTSVSANSFLMMLPGNKEHATTTITVNVSNTTKFMLGSTTAMLSDVSVGSHVEVMGKVSTSTKTITAERVYIATKPPAMHSDSKENLFSRIKMILMGKHGTSTSERGDHSTTSPDSAAAVEGNGYFGTLFRAFLSLF